MIHSKAPFRVSLVGGGTDHPEYFLREGCRGGVISLAIDKYCHVIVKRLPKYFTHKIRLAYSVVEEVNQVEDIAHPLIRAALFHFQIQSEIEIIYISDLPARTGIGSSSAFAVALVSALSLYKGEQLTRLQILTKARYLEREMLGEAVGLQDHIASTFGGFNRIDFAAGSNFSITPISIPKSNFPLFLCYTGISRDSFSIEGRKINSVSNNNQSVLKSLGKQYDLVGKFSDDLTRGVLSVGELGKYLNESHRLKMELDSGVENSEVTRIINIGLSNGAAGAKVIGSGGGGFVLFAYEEGREFELKQALSSYILVDFDCDMIGLRTEQMW